jgi:hypothetical protein
MKWLYVSHLLYCLLALENVTSATCLLVVIAVIVIVAIVVAVNQCVTAAKSNCIVVFMLVTNEVTAFIDAVVAKETCNGVRREAPSSGAWRRKIWRMRVVLIEARTPAAEPPSS